MAVQLYAFESGRLEVPHGFLLEGARGKITVPVPSYLILHPKGRILFGHDPEFWKTIPQAPTRLA